MILSFRSGFSTFRFSLKIKSFTKQKMFYRSDIFHDFSISSFGSYFLTSFQVFLEFFDFLEPDFHNFFLQLNKDFFTLNFISGGITQCTKKLFFCYSYGLIEMLLQAWPYRVPSNQELTIINSIFYNLMQSRFIINFLLIQRVYN